MAAFTQICNKGASYLKSNATPQFRLLCLDPIIAALSVGLATFSGPVQYLVHNLYNQYSEQHKQELKRSISGVYKSNLKIYPIILPLKDYLKQKMRKNFLKALEDTNIIQDIGINLVSPFIAAYVWSSLFFNTSLPKVAVVNMYMQQQKLRKYYQQKNKSWFYIWKEIIKRRNVGFFAHTLGVGISNIAKIGIFDIAQMFLPQQAKYFIIPNIFIATLTSYLGNLIFIPFLYLSMAKKSHSNRIQVQTQIIYQTKPYKNLLQQSWKISKQNLKKKRGLQFGILNLRGGLIIVFYQRIKMSLYQNKTLYF